MTHDPHNYTSNDPGWNRRPSPTKFWEVVITITITTAFIWYILHRIFS